MSLPRTFVSFSSTDIGSYRLMCAWKASEHIDFNFADFQLDEAINSQSPSYIKTVCRNKILRSDTFVLLIGADTWSKTDFVRAEVEVALEKRCRLIGVNLDHWWSSNPSTCPQFYNSVGALFVPFSARIVGHALDESNWRRSILSTGNHYFLSSVYAQLGYVIEGNCARIPLRPSPFQFGKPYWAK